MRSIARLKLCQAEGCGVTPVPDLSSQSGDEAREMALAGTGVGSCSLSHYHSLGFPAHSGACFSSYENHHSLDVLVWEVQALCNLLEAEQVAEPRSLCLFPSHREGE